EYVVLWRELRKYASSTMDFGFVIEGTQVQFLPTTISPIYESAVKHARGISVKGLRTKIVDRELLIRWASRAWRTKDKIRAATLIPDAKLPYLKQLLDRFDRDGTLAKRLEALN
ncbi:MAG: hypothetical protein HY667_05160, partial [Chloroflexi bacterium]|nr:hypothetical protein [Chloroflexota bacterium]